MELRGKPRRRSAAGCGTDRRRAKSYCTYVEPAGGSTHPSALRIRRLQPKGHELSGLARMLPGASRETKEAQCRQPRRGPTGRQRCVSVASFGRAVKRADRARRKGAQVGRRFFSDDAPRDVERRGGGSLGRRPCLIPPISLVERDLLGISPLAALPACGGSRIPGANKGSMTGRREQLRSSATQPSARPQHILYTFPPDLSAGAMTTLWREP